MCGCESLYDYFLFLSIQRYTALPRVREKKHYSQSAIPVGQITVFNGSPVSLKHYSSNIFDVLPGPETDGTET
jgi:hypothetical protein